MFFDTKKILRFGSIFLFPINCMIWLVKINRSSLEYSKSFRFLWSFYRNISRKFRRFLYVDVLLNNQEAAVSRMYDLVYSVILFWTGWALVALVANCGRPMLPIRSSATLSIRLNFSNNCFIVFAYGPFLTLSLLWKDLLVAVALSFSRLCFNTVNISCSKAYTTLINWCSCNRNAFLH